MLKLTLFLALLGLACAADDIKWDRIPVAANSSQCIYRTDTSLLSCRGPGEVVVECPGVLDSSRFGARRIDVFGISQIAAAAAGGDQKPESVRFALFPRDFDNTTYLNDSIQVEGGQQVDLRLRFSADNDTASSGVAGIRVSDVKCYQRLVDLFNSSAVDHIVQIGNNKVNLLGEILVADKSAQKRWLGGLWGWGLGFGWPFWGLGLGLGLWGR